MSYSFWCSQRDSEHHLLPGIKSACVNFTALLGRHCGRATAWGSSTPPRKLRKCRIHKTVNTRREATQTDEIKCNRIFLGTECLFNKTGSQEVWEADLGCFRHSEYTKELINYQARAELKPKPWAILLWTFLSRGVWRNQVSLLELQVWRAVERSSQRSRRDAGKFTPKPSTLCI